MRLRDIQHILATHLDTLVVERQDVTFPSNDKGFQLSISARNLDFAARALSDIPVLHQLTQAILDNRLVRQTPPDEALRGPQAPVLELYSQIRTLHSTASQLAALVNELLPAEDALSLSIKLPSATTVDEVENLIGDIKMIFDQTSRRVVGEGFAFEGFDRGSNWFTLIAASSAVLLFAAGLLRVAVRYNAKRLDRHNNEVFLKELNALSDAIREATEAGLKSLVRAWSAELVATSASEASRNNNENIELTLSAVERLNTLYMKHLETRFALKAPTSVAATAPTPGDFQQLLLRAKRANYFLPQHAHTRLSEDNLRAVHTAAITLGLGENRDALLATIDKHIVSALPHAPDVASQLFTDIFRLNEIQLSDGTIPLVSWLKNAITFRSHQSEAFSRALQLITGEPRDENGA